MLLYTKNHNAKRAIIQLQNQLDSTVQWFKKWYLHVNPQKTKAIIFNNQITKYLNKLKIYQQKIEWLSHAKYLGINIDKNLNFDAHITDAIKKATGIRGMLYAVLGKSSAIPTKTKINVYMMYIRSILTYAKAAWGVHFSKTN